jgi:glycosyltransferase involved in cell wall biosynthesis
MKIAIVTFNLNVDAGGNRLLFSFARALRGFGHGVVIFAPEVDKNVFPELQEGLDLREIKQRAKLDWSANPKALSSILRRKIEQERLHIETARNMADSLGSDFDIIYLSDFAYRVGYFYRKARPHSRIMWIMNEPPYQYLPKENLIFDILSRVYNRWKDISSRRYFRVVDRVFVLDSYNKKWCEERGLASVVVRLGVDFKNFYLPVKDFTPRAKAKKIRVFALGSLNQYRHYEDTISATKILRDWGYDATALIIANDRWDEKEYREKLLQLIRDNNLAAAVDLRFKGVPEDGLRAAYRESDVFSYAMYVPPPRNGFGFSIGVFEAMAAGVPVVLCRTTTSTEVLEDMKTALFVDPMSPKQIAQKVKFLVDNPKVYFAIASAGQKFVKENLTWEKYAKEMLG